MRSTPKRRDFLRAAATGAAVSPLLWKFARPPLAHADSGAPKRLLIFWNPQGNCSGLRLPSGEDPFWPTGSEYDFKLSRILKPLEKHRGDLLVLKGFHDWYTDCMPVVNDGEHGFGTVCRLTNICPVNSTPGSFEDSRIQWAGGKSIDQEIAAVVGKTTLRPSLVLSGRTSTLNHRGFICYDPYGKGIPTQDNPADVYQQLFGSSAGADANKAAAIRTLRKSSLDLVSQDIASLQKRLPASERIKMDAQLSAVRLLEREFDKNLSASCSRASGFADGAPMYGLAADKVAGRHTLMLKTVAAAFACDVTRVATVMACCGGGDNSDSLDYFDPNWANNYHSSGHLSGGNDAESVGGETRADAIELLTKVGTYYAQQLADFVDILKAIPEGNGTVFDNTLIYWTAEMGQGNHSNYDIPHVLIGGGWKFKTGRFLDLPAAGLFKSPPDNRFGDLLISIAQAMGHDIRTFGKPGWCTGPIPQLLA